MERRQTLDSSMSSLYSAASSTNPRQQQLQQQQHQLQLPPASQHSTLQSQQSQLDAFNYSATMSSSSPTPSQANSSTSSLRATTIGTVVVRCGPIQLVIALLQVSYPPPSSLSLPSLSDCFSLLLLLLRDTTRTWTSKISVDNSLTTAAIYAVRESERGGEGE